MFLRFKQNRHISLSLSQRSATFIWFIVCEFHNWHFEFIYIRKFNMLKIDAFICCFFFLFLFLLSVMLLLLLLLDISQTQGVCFSDWLKFGGFLYSSNNERLRIESHDELLFTYLYFFGFLKMILSIDLCNYSFCFSAQSVCVL